MDMAITAGNILTMLVMGGGIAVAWGMIRAQVINNKERLEDHDKQLRDNAECQQKIMIGLAEMRRDIVYIRETMDRLSK